ncbi:hypothetical protein ACQ4PT_070244 [Festuca glaucescens]
MAPPPLATAAAAAAAKSHEEILEVRCVGCRETLEVERGLTEFVCPDCGTPQSLPPELMPPPRRRALPMPRSAADARGARLPCGACGELLSVPVGLSRCACPFCGAELAVDSARLRNYILSSAAAAVVPLAPATVSPIVAARETWQEHSSYSMYVGLPRAEPNARLIPTGRAQIERPSRLIHVHRDEQKYPHHMTDREEIPVANETVANNSLQRNRLSPGHRTLGNEERHVFPLNEVRDHVKDQHPSYIVQPKRAKMAHLHRVIHSEEMQEGPLSHEVCREARRTELIYETAATHRNQRVGCSAAPQSLSVEDKHMETPSEIIQQAHKHPYHESHAEGSHVGCLDMDGVVHPPFNQANHHEPVQSDPDDLLDFAPNMQVPSVSMEDEPMEWGPFQRRSASPDCEVSVATANTESVESEQDEHHDVSPDQSMSKSEPPDIDGIIADLCPSTPSAHKMAQEISDESDAPDSTTIPSDTDMSDPERFARNYCLLLPPEVRRTLAKKKPKAFLDRLMSQGSNKASLHDLSDSEEQQEVKRGKKEGGCGHLSVKVWTLPKGVRIPVSLNTSGLPVGENATMLINFLGALARDAILAPFTYISWKSIPTENKSVMWHIVKLKFDVDPPHQLPVLTFIRNKRRVWKSHLKRKHYDSHVTEEERLADRDPRVPKEQWKILVAYWNTEKFKAISAAGKACRAKSTYINVTGSKSFARIHEEESRSGDPAHENPEGSGGDYASVMGAERRGRTRRHKPGPSPEDLQGRSASQAARAERKAGDEASTLKEEVVVTEEIRNPQVWAASKDARAERRAEEEAAALRKKVIVMEQSQKKLQEDLARMTNAMSAIQNMMSTGGLPNGSMGGPMVPPKL